MLYDKDTDKFIKIQWQELEGLLKYDVIDIHLITSLPPTAKPLSSIWSYYFKHLPYGELNQYKSRISVNGKEPQFSWDLWGTYDTVASWTTIRLLLLISAILNLKMHQVDYTWTFHQAKLQDPVFLKIPQGWVSDPNGMLCQHSNPKCNNTKHNMHLKHKLQSIRYKTSCIQLVPILCS